MKPSKILVAIDFSPASIAAARRALALAGEGGVLRLVHVLATDLVPRHAYVGQDLVEQLLARLEAEAGLALRKLASELTGAGPVVETHVCRGRPADRIVADGSEQDLVVIGAHARTGIERFALGSVAEEVARESPTPVLVVRESAEGSSTTRRVLVAVDVADPNEAALEVASRLAETLGAKLEAIHAVAMPISLPAYHGGDPVKEIALDIENRIRDEAPKAVRSLVSRTLGASADVHVVFGSPAAEIVRAARPDDIVVVGTHGRGLLGRIVLGSVSQKVLREAPCPVLVVRPRKDA